MYENRCTGEAEHQLLRELILEGEPMVRDDDYLRELLLEFEASDEWTHVVSQALSRSPEDSRRKYHVLLLADAGFMAPVGPSIYRITNQGHDFIALTRRNEAWEAAKNAVGHLGGASVQMLYRAAEGLARKALSDMGVPGM